jgi:hypothetical protein
VSAPALSANLKQPEKRLTATNTLVYYGTELIATSKSFIMLPQHDGGGTHASHNPAKVDYPAKKVAQESFLNFEMEKLTMVGSLSVTKEFAQQLHVGSLSGICI